MNEFSLDHLCTELSQLNLSWNWRRIWIPPFLLNVTHLPVYLACINIATQDTQFLQTNIICMGGISWLNLEMCRSILLVGLPGWSDNDVMKMRNADNKIVVGCFSCQRTKPSKKVFLDLNGLLSNIMHLKCYFNFQFLNILLFCCLPWMASLLLIYSGLEIIHDGWISSS